jgi:Tfp pilus assembly protein PilO
MAFLLNLVFVLAVIWFVILGVGQYGRNQQAKEQEELKEKFRKHIDGEEQWRK